MIELTKQRIAKFILWKEVLSIPIYTILFNNFQFGFWISIIIDRIILLIIICKPIKIDEIIGHIFDSDDSNLIRLAIFSAISSLVLYILTFYNNRDLFYILIICEIADYIVNKLLSK